MSRESRGAEAPLLHRISGAGQEAEIDAAAEKAQGLGLFIRSLVGLDRQAAVEAFGHYLDGSRFTARSDLWR